MKINIWGCVCIATFDIMYMNHLLGIYNINKNACILSTRRYMY